MTDPTAVISHVERLVRWQSRETPGGYVGVAVARSDAPTASVSFLHGERLRAPRRSSVASITKPITATAVMQLVEEHKLALDEPIATYVPEFAPMPPSGATSARAVTIRHVLSHTSGLSDLPDEVLRQLPPTAAAMVGAVAHQRLRFEPGTAYAYASEPWYLLSAIIERVSGASYRDHVRRRILEPLGMRATTFDPREPGPAALPPGGASVVGDRPADEVVALMAGLAMPGGGLWSTPEDVATFGRALLISGTIDGVPILGRRSLERMTRLETARVPGFNAGEPVHYALGWNRPALSGRSPASESAFGHTGATGSALVIDPAHDLVVVHLRNWWGVSMDATDEAIAAVYESVVGTHASR